MKSATTRSFREDYAKLPDEVQERARVAYRLWRKNPDHPSLHFKKVGQRYWSARVGLAYRVLGETRGDTMYWIWIGSHGEYDRLLRNEG